MNKLNKIFFGLIAGALFIGMTAACSDFEDINKDPSAAGKEYVHPDYALNKSLYEAQQNPHIGERLFVLNWADASRIIGDAGILSDGWYDDSWNHDTFNYMSDWIKYATLAIQLADGNEGSSEHEKDFFANILQFARIWRAMLIADFSDTFGPYPLDGFSGVNPTFSSVKDVYYFLLADLKDAAANIKAGVEPTDMEAKGDPAFGYNAEKWLGLANSLRMRYAMRLSEVDPAKAKAEFEDAAKGRLLTDDIFSFPEGGGWSAYEPVFSRDWDICCLSSTMCNILNGLGDVPVADYRPDLLPYVKPMNYIGEEYKGHFPENTDNPTKQMWMDGIPEHLDPRALVYFFLIKDTEAPNYDHRRWGPFGESRSEGVLSAHDEYYDQTLDSAGKDIIVDAQFTWNGYPAGTEGGWCPGTFAYNQLIAQPHRATPLLGVQFRNQASRRIWFASWETYFLLAEGAVRGWAAPVGAKDAYENGVRANFEYLGVGKYADQYLASKCYNRVGTSVNFDHTYEPEDFKADYVDGYTKEAKTKVYKYPDANKILYKGHKLNDRLTKIITQKYIANTPYGAVECWNDHRRLGLPFFQMPGNEITMTGSEMEEYYKSDDYTTGQKYYHFPQRMRYPSSLENADAEQFQYALDLMNADRNTIMIPLWWAIQP